MSQMENPGLKHHAAPMPVPHTLNIDPYRNPVEPYAQTTRQDVETPPSPTGVVTPEPASAANGAPALKSQEAMLAEQNRHADQARIDRAKMPGAGSTAQNPAWSRAHDTVQQKVQERRMSALHRTADWDDEDDEPEYGMSQSDVDRKVGRDVIPTMEAQGWTTVHHKADGSQSGMFDEASQREYDGPKYHFEKAGPAGIKSLMTFDFHPVNGNHEDTEPGWHIGTFGPAKGMPGGYSPSRFESFVDPRNADLHHKQHVLDIGHEVRQQFKDAEDYGFTHSTPEEGNAGLAYMRRDLGLPGEISRDPKHVFPEGVNKDLFQRTNSASFWYQATQNEDSAGQHFAYHDVRDDLGRFAPTGTRRREDMKIKPGKFDQAERELGSRTKALAWDRLRRENPEVAIGPDESYASHYERLKANERKKDPRKRQHNRIKNHTSMTAYAETDEEFWARQPDVLDTSSAGSGFFRGSGDAAGMDHLPEDEPLPHAYGESDLDDVIPDNMSLREHASLLRSMDWDGDTRYPKYERNLWRNISDSEGNPVGAKEGHVIEHNTTHRGPVLPSDDDPNPHPLRYPFTHTYYPAGEPDANGWTAGHNTAEGALANMRQISLYGEHHPESQALLKRYTRVGDDAPYDPHANG